jgi:ubiquinone/menaquinone biosynthesis C-methylase UbiE
MRNPWLDIPYQDYVGHMASPEVAQRPLLCRLLGDVLTGLQPQSFLFLGCSDGNGLEHVNPRITTHVVCVDLNPVYLAQLRQRFPQPAFTLDVRYGDVVHIDLPPATLDVVHAALLLEYVSWPALLPRAAEALRAGGTLSVVLQRPTPTNPAVTPTCYSSLRSLEPVFTFVHPPDLLARAATSGLILRTQRTERLPTGKEFEVLWLQRSAG